MQHITAMIVKYVLTTAVLALAFPLFGQTTIFSLFSIAFGVTVITYWVGEMSILPFWGNIPTVFGDLVVGTGVLYATQFFVPNTAISLLGAIAVSAVWAIMEWYFHQLLSKYWTRLR